MEKGAINVLHTNVFELAPNKFKCLVCGLEWTQSITSPLMVTNNEIKDFYPESKRIDCKETF